MIGKIRKDREFPDGRAAEQIADRDAKPARHQIVQRAIDAAFCQIVAQHDAVEIIQYAGDVARIASDQRLAQGIERAFDGRMRRAVVIHRGGVAVADRAIFRPNADGPTLRRRTRREGEFPVLVFSRENRFLDERLDDLHPGPSPICSLDTELMDQVVRRWAAP